MEVGLNEREISVEAGGCGEAAGIPGSGRCVLPLGQITLFDSDETKGFARKDLRECLLNPSSVAVSASLRGHPQPSKRGKDFCRVQSTRVIQIDKGEIDDTVHTYHISCWNW